jgi:hypothetical protein
MLQIGYRQASLHQSQLVLIRDGAQFRSLEKKGERFVQLIAGHEYANLLCACR